MKFLLETGYEHLSEKHNEGVEEYVTVITGTLQLEINEQQYTIQPGNSIRFSANEAHTYRNIGEDMIIYQTVLYYP